MTSPAAILALGLAILATLPACAGAPPRAVPAALPMAVEGQALPTLAPMLERAAPAVVNDRPVRTSAGLRNAIGLLRVGETVQLKLLRDGRSLTLNARIGEATPEAARGAELTPHLAGALFQDIEPGSPYHGRIEGVVVARVEPGSPAAREGLRPGDVITAINRAPIAGVADLQRAAALGGPLLLQVQRGRRTLLLMLH